MKHVILTIFSTVLLTFVPGCKKDNNGKNAAVSSSIAGKWELRQSSAAMNPMINNYLPGNGNIIKFTTTSYEMYADGQLTKKGLYKIVSDTTVQESVCLVFPKNRFTSRIVYDGDYTAPKIFLEITNNRLTFIAGCYAYDAGHSSEYDRESDDGK